MDKDGQKTGDRDLECEAYLLRAFDMLVAKAFAAGWSEDEICNALLSLAQERIAAARDGAVLESSPEPGGYKH